jgi:hypothetical protein
MAVQRNGNHRFSGATLVNCGRAALALAIRYAEPPGFSKRNRFLLPSYLCRTMIQPFVEAGLQVKFYGVNRNLRVEAESIASQIDSETFGVLLMHYFGFPQNSDLAERLHRTFPDVRLIDDRTHLLLSDVAKAFGSPDPAIAVYSARKWAPFPDLGIVIWSRTTLSPDKAAPLFDAWYHLPFLKARIAGLVLRSVYLSFPCETLRRLSLRPVHTADDILDRRVVVSRASPVSQILWRRWDWKSAWHIRRRNFEYLLQNWPRQAGEPLYDSLPRDVCPLGFPIRSFDRDTLRARMVANRVYPPVHWCLPREVDPESFPESARLAEEELTLPIDQRYSLRDMDLILEVARAQ